MEERIFNDFDTTRKLSFSTHVLFLWREFNLHARSRASNIHHCWRESKIKGRNRRKQGSNQRTFFIHVRTRRELIFSSTSFSVSNTSPRVFALHCFACYCFTSLQEEKNIQRGNVIVTRRENDHDNKYALLPLIHPLFRSSLFLSDHWISRSIIVLKQTRDQNHFLDNFVSKIFPPLGHFKREINLLLRRPLQ